ncbi:MAG TPA: glycosyltransferase [Solirubrobacteraceae bacterium]|nr:glycosyltransferase [Solirubrobacteraceae bacterium]
MRTTILMLSVDEAWRLERSLPAALAQPGAEVLVVDNACSDGTAELAGRLGARVLALPERRSYAAAINAGLAAARDAGAVALVNADCTLDAGFLAAAGPRLEEPGVGSVAPLLLRATGMEEANRLDVLDAAGMTIDRRRKNGLIGHGTPARPGTGPGPEPFGPDGACAVYRREVLDAAAVDGEVLDEDMALWASDADLAWRARLAGWRCVHEPRALGWHVRFYSPTTRAALPPEHRRLQFRNRLLMMAKNDRWSDLRGDLHHVLGYEVLALGHALVRERSLLPAYADALRHLPAARRRRLVVQSRRRAGRPPFAPPPRAQWRARALISAAPGQ